MRNVTILLAVVAVVALAVPVFGAATYITTNWTGGTGSWNVTGNWDNGVPPCPPPANTYCSAYIANGGTCQISQDSIANNRFHVGRYAEGHGEMLANDPITGDPLPAYTLGAGSGMGEIKIGYIDLSAQSGGHTCTFKQMGGHLYSSSGIEVGTGGISGTSGEKKGDGIWTISGGSVSQGNANYRYVQVGVYAAGAGRVDGTYGIGRLKIVGTGPTSIQFNCYTQTAFTYLSVDYKSVLEIVLDDNGDVTPIQVTGTNAGYRDAVLAGELLLNAGAYSGPAKTIDILSVTGTGTLDYSGLSLDAASVAAGCTLTNTGKILQVNYVPEPATMVLLGLGGIGVLLRRKRRA